MFFVFWGVFWGVFFAIVNIFSYFYDWALDSHIFAKHLFGFPYKINSSLLIATTKREHLLLKKLKVEFNASEETHRNVLQGNW